MKQPISAIEARKRSEYSLNQKALIRQENIWCKIHEAIERGDDHVIIDYDSDPAELDVSFLVEHGYHLSRQVRKGNGGPMYCWLVSW